jgi:class 3 adenylate cyclase/CHASE2 domain-containing sensor protein
VQILGLARAAAAVAIGLAAASWLPRAVPAVAYLDLSLSPSGRTHEPMKAVVIQVRRETFEKMGAESLGGTLPRRFHARLLAELERAGSRAVVFDLLFSDPSPDDDVFRQALVESEPLRVVIPVEPLGEGESRPDQTQYRFRRPAVLPMLRPENVIVGHPIAWEPDGVLRGVRLVVEDAEIPGLIYPHLALATLIPSSLDEIGVDGDDGGFQISVMDRVWRAGPALEKLIRWGPNFAEIEYSEALRMLENGEVNPFRDAVVVVGASNQGQRLDDMHPTPLGDMSGSQFTAHAARSLALPRERQPSFLESRQLAALSLLLATVSTWLAYRPNALRVALAFSLPLAAAWGLSNAAMAWASLHIGVLQSSLGALGAAVLLVGTHAALYHPVWLRLGWVGKREEVCALFVDIEGSTPMVAAARDPALLMVEIQRLVAAGVEGAGGYVERTIGDGAFAVFRKGSQDQRARSALAAILETREAMRSKGDWFEERFGVRPSLAFGAEMAEVEGEVLSSRHRQEFSSFGLDIARAQRIESLAREFPSRAAIGPKVHALLRGDEAGFQLHYRPMKGFEGPQELYEVQPLPSSDKRG